MIDFYDISYQHILMHLVLISVGRETKGTYYGIAFVEPARRQIAQHGAHILVFELRAAKLTEHNVALHDLATLTLLTLHAEGLALAHNS